MRKTWNKEATALSLLTVMATKRNEMRKAWDERGSLCFHCLP